jgi:hypothetical protein
VLLHTLQPASASCHVGLSSWGPAAAAALVDSQHQPAAAASAVYSGSLTFQRWLQLRLQLLQCHLRRAGLQ